MVAMSEMWEMETDTPLTHFVSYELKNLGTNWVETPCGRIVHITEFSAQPTCRDKRCQIAAARHRLTRAREKV
jgi:hypothetical protein